MNDLVTRDLVVLRNKKNHIFTLHIMEIKASNSQSVAFVRSKYIARTTN